MYSLEYVINKVEVFRL